mgnify:FL=1
MILLISARVGDTMNLPPSKHFNNKGKWVPKPIQTEILLCSCGNKYIKTRKDQKICVRCIHAARLEGK